jgi:hypothetical protein
MNSVWLSGIAVKYDVHSAIAQQTGGRHCFALPWNPAKVPHSPKPLVSLRIATEKQEREVVSDPKLLMVAVCALNHWTMHEIVELFRLTDAE